MRENHSGDAELTSWGHQFSRKHYLKKCHYVTDQSFLSVASALWHRSTHLPPPCPISWWWNRECTVYSSQLLQNGWRFDVNTFTRYNRVGMVQDLLHLPLSAEGCLFTKNRSSSRFHRRIDTVIRRFRGFIWVRRSRGDFIYERIKNVSFLSLPLLKN